MLEGFKPVIWFFGLDFLVNGFVFVVMDLTESVLFYKVLENVYRDGKSNSIQLDLKFECCEGF